MEVIENKMLRSKNISFFVGNQLHTVESDDLNAETTLNSYLRKNVYLTGTKRMCLEGGCGVCIVAVEENVNGKRRVFAVNSCLVSILSCHGWKIQTIEGIGNPLIGFHHIQKLLADNNGSQCGFCSDGMVMNMYALNESGPKTKLEIENSFGGNICRCTGYRPILEAFKKLATDNEAVTDIEDLSKNECKKSCALNNGHLFKQSFCIELSDFTWIKVHNLSDLLNILQTNSYNKYMLVAGNTARGVYKNFVVPDLYIDVREVAELTTYSVDDSSLTLGGNVTLTKTLEIFREISKTKKQFSFLDAMADHIDLVATIPVRNIGTIAGNLMIKYAHNEFPSDIFLLLETVGAFVTIVDTSMKEIQTTPANFLKMNMNKKVIKNIIIKSLDDTYKFNSYKIMPRAQNAHAMVNAGFLLKFNNKNIESARIVYGGINPGFIHATNTENLVKGHDLYDNDFLQTIYASLDKEIVPDYVLPDPTPEYRKNLAISLFYKFVLKTAPPELVTPKNISGGTILTRPVSSGVQEFGTEKQKWPVSKPVIKYEALSQTSGNTKYIDDIPDIPDQLHAAFVTAKAPANSYIIGIDATEALKIPGVVAFYDKDDIPGQNTFTPETVSQFTLQEELFCSGRVQYYDQPVGVIVANEHDLAWKAAETVKITYKSPTVKPFLNVKDVLDANAKDRIHSQTTIIAKRKGDDVKKVIKGNFYINWQYHFHMELQCCSVVPWEGGLNVYPSTQWMDSVQSAIAAVLNINMSKINISVSRLGGAFGAKVVRNSLPSTAAALAAYKLQKPVKIWMPLESNMSVIGKRYPFYVKYEVGVNNSGVIQYMNADLYSDYGLGRNENVDVLLYPSFENCYDISTWNFSTYIVNTDTAANCYTRAPGTAEGLGAIESIMEHIAYELNLDVFSVKLVNTNQTKYPQINDYWKDMQNSADIQTRKQEIQSFNSANRWKKKGMTTVPMVWLLTFIGQFGAVVSIYHGDGTVVITHGGIEMGQGINTKVRQVCAYKFQIPLDLVEVKPSYNVTSPNVFSSAASLTSEAVCFAILRACDELLEIMQPIRDQMENPTWVDLVNKCYDNDIYLSSIGSYNKRKMISPSYDIFGMATVEVEVDILTGQKEILRVDIIEDVGDSMSPLIDIGQVEGAFVMGIGYYTTEEIIFDENGRLVTNRTWNYKPPGAKDIPIDFRISFPKNNPNPVGVLQSKAIAEPPLCLSVAVPLAIRNAIASARTDADPKAPKFFFFDGPTTVEKSFLNSLNAYKDYVL